MDLYPVSDVEDSENNWLLLDEVGEIEKDELQCATRHNYEDEASLATGDMVDLPPTTEVLPSTTPSLQEPEDLHSEVSSSPKTATYSGISHSKLQKEESVDCDSNWVLLDEVCEMDEKTELRSLEDLHKPEAERNKLSTSSSPLLNDDRRKRSHNEKQESRNSYSPKYNRSKDSPDSSGRNERKKGESTRDVSKSSRNSDGRRRDSIEREGRFDKSSSSSHHKEYRRRASHDNISGSRESKQARKGNKEFDSKSSKNIKSSDSYKLNYSNKSSKSYIGKDERSTDRCNQKRDSDNQDKVDFKCSIDNKSKDKSEPMMKNNEDPSTIQEKRTPRWDVKLPSVIQYPLPMFYKASSCSQNQQKTLGSKDFVESVNTTTSIPSANITEGTFGSHVELVNSAEKFLTAQQSQETLLSYSKDIPNSYNKTPMDSQEKNKTSSNEDSNGRRNSYGKSRQFRYNYLHGKGFEQEAAAELSVHSMSELKKMEIKSKNIPGQKRKKLKRDKITHNSKNHTASLCTTDLNTTPKYDFKMINICSINLVQRTQLKQLLDRGCPVEESLISVLSSEQNRLFEKRQGFNTYVQSLSLRETGNEWADFHDFVNQLQIYLGGIYIVTQPNYAHVPPSQTGHVENMMTQDDGNFVSDVSSSVQEHTDKYCSSSITSIKQEDAVPLAPSNSSDHEASSFKNMECSITPKEECAKNNSGLGGTENVGLFISSDSPSETEDQPFKGFPVEVSDSKSNIELPVQQVEEINDGPTKMVITTVDFPSVRLTTEQIKMVQEDVLEHIMNNTTDVSPTFEDYSIEDGYLSLTCQDRATADWLKIISPKLKPWNSACLSARHENEISKLLTVTVIIFFPESLSYGNEKILNLVKSQNSGLKVDKWKVVQRIDKEDGTTEMVIDIDLHSAEVLEKKHMKISYKFGVVDVKKKVENLTSTLSEKKKIISFQIKKLSK